MTVERCFVRSKQKRRISYGQIFLGLFSLFCLLLLLKNADVAVFSMKEGLLLCAKTVIPSLFPFMVLSELILSAELLQRLLKKLTAPLQRLFRLSSVGCCALLLGLLCGFPVGARCAVSAYDKGVISKEETQHVVLFSGVPSSAFLINAVGISLFQNRRIGLLLWGSVLLSALLTGLLFTRRKKKKEDLPHCENPLLSQKASGGALLFTNAVATATRSILLICAYVVFFSTLAGAMNAILQSFRVPPLMQALIFGSLELSVGVHQAARLFAPSIALLLCAFAAGWSGISVHCQLLSVCEGRNLSFRNYFIAKLLQGIFCVLLCAVAMNFFDL